MLPLLLIVLAQTQPAVKRTTPASDDPGMVVRQVGTVNVNCTSGCSGSGGGWTPDGGYIGSVTAIVEFDGGLVTANQGTPASTANRWPVQLTDGTDLSLVSAAGALLVDGSGVTQPISAASLPLPTGASTSALQTTGNTSLSNIDTKTPSLGQTTMAGSSPVVIASNQSAVPVDSELPAAAALADATSNPTTTSVGSLLLGYNGTTWDRLRSTIAGGLLVDVSDSFLLDATFTGRLPAGASLTENFANPTTTQVAAMNMVWDGSAWDRAPGTSADGTLVNLGANNDVSLNAGTNYVGRVRQTDGTLDLSLLNSAPGSDTGQVSVPVRIISSLAGGAGGTSSSYGAAFPATGTAAGFSDGTNMQGARVFDADTGGGTQYVAGASIRVSASGGSTEAAAGAGTTSASTLRVVLPTDQTSIPVTDNGGSLTVDGTVAVSSVGGTVTVSGTVDTELPAAAALADATANPTTTSVGALGLLFNGTTWDRMRGDTTNGLLVNVSDSFLLDATFTGRFAAGAALADNFANPTTTQTGAMNMLWDGATWDRAPGNSTDGMLVNLGANNDVTVTGTVAATQSGTWNINNVSGTVSLPTGAATETTLGTRLAESTFTGRFSAGAAASDNFSNPTTTGTLAFNMVWDGSTWDRLPGTSALGLTSNTAFINGVAPSMGNGVSGTGVQRVTIASDSTGTLAVTQATASNLRTQTSAEGATGSAVPANASQAGFSDGTNLRAARVYDTNTAGGTEYTLGAILRVSSSGGSAEVTSASTDNGSTGLAVYPISKFVTTGPTVTAVTCATSATAAPASTLSGRVTVTLYNNSSSTIYIGPSTVTTSNGLPLLPGASFTDNVEDTPYYCRVSSGTAELRVLEN